MPPPGYEPFLRAICENPEDDTVRLVYADWLDENGDPDRAEFIRLQVAVPTRPTEHDERYARADELRRKNWDLWFGALPKLSGITWATRFSRGFVRSANISPGKWLTKQRDAFFGATPISALTLLDAGLGTLVEVLDLSEATRLSGLWLRHCRLRHGEWRILTHCPNVTNLKGLRFDAPLVKFGKGHPAALNDDDVRGFVESPHLPRLESLVIEGNLGESAVRLLRTRFKEVKTWDWIPPDSPSP